MKIIYQLDNNGRYNNNSNNHGNNNSNDINNGTPVYLITSTADR